MTTQITMRQILDLQTEAGEAGDYETFELCDRAIEGDAEARERLAEIIAEAKARSGE